jgi:hypothetical protein
MPNPAFSTTGRIGAFCVTLEAVVCGFADGGCKFGQRLTLSLGGSPLGKAKTTM